MKIFIMMIALMAMVSCVVAQTPEQKLKES